MSLEGFNPETKAREIVIDAIATQLECSHDQVSDKTALSQYGADDFERILIEIEDLGERLPQMEHHPHFHLDDDELETAKTVHDLIEITYKTLVGALRETKTK